MVAGWLGASAGESAKKAEKVKRQPRNEGKWGRRRVEGIAGWNAVFARWSAGPFEFLSMLLACSESNVMSSDNSG